MLCIFTFKISRSYSETLRYYKKKGEIERIEKILFFCEFSKRKGRQRDRENSPFFSLRIFLGIKSNTYESILVRWVNLESIIQSEVDWKEKKISHINPIYSKYIKMVLMHTLAG